MKRTYLYKAKIDKQTEANCLRWLYLCRTLYNLALEQRILVYHQWRISFHLYTQMYELSELRKAFPEFTFVNYQTLKNVIRRVHLAYQAFFRRVKQHEEKMGFPKFKGRENYNSFTLDVNGWKLEGRNLYVTKVGRFKLFLSRPIEGKIKTITVKRSDTGKWFVAFSCDEVPIREYPLAEAAIGIDVGVKHFLTDSEGNQVENPKYLQKSTELLVERQQSKDQKKRGSHRRRKARHLIAKIHEKITNQRRDFLHKVANQYVKSYQVICVEDLDIKDMLKNGHRCLNRQINDSPWGTFLNLLSYKAKEAERKLVRVPAKDTTQRCSDCGQIVPKDLSVRVHRCPHCGLVMDRDINAACNILRAGQALRPAGREP